MNLLLKIELLKYELLKIELKALIQNNGKLFLIGAFLVLFQFLNYSFYVVPTISMIITFGIYREERLNQLDLFERTIDISEVQVVFSKFAVSLFALAVLLMVTNLPLLENFAKGSFVLSVFLLISIFATTSLYEFVMQLTTALLLSTINLLTSHLGLIKVYEIYFLLASTLVVLFACVQTAKGFERVKISQGKVLICAICFAISFAIVAKFGGQIDLTTNKIYTLHDNTNKMLASLQAEVFIYPFQSAQSLENLNQQKEIINLFKQNSPNITVENDNPLNNKAVEKFYLQATSDQDFDGVIVVSGERVKIVPTQEVEQTLQQQTFQEQTFQQQLTNAINQVAGVGANVIYYATNHGEQELPQALINELNHEGYEIVNLDLQQTKAIPNDCSLIFLTTPETDYTDEEVKIFENYINQSGKLLFLLDAVEKPMVNLSTILNHFKIKTGDYFVVETDAQNFAQANPLYVMLLISQNETTKKLDRTNGEVYVVAPNSQAIWADKNNKNVENVEYIQLLQTSKTSYGKTAENITTIQREQGDTKGPFDVAIYARKLDNYAKCVVVGNSFITNESANVYTKGGNYTFIKNIIDYLVNPNY